MTILIAAVTAVGAMGIPQAAQRPGTGNGNGGEAAPAAGVYDGGAGFLEVPSPSVPEADIVIDGELDEKPHGSPPPCSPDSRSSIRSRG